MMTFSNYPSNLENSITKNKMSKGGFLAEMLASKTAKSDVGYLTKVLYYAYIALPLALFYWTFVTVLLMLPLVMVVDLVMGKTVGTTLKDFMNSGTYTTALVTIGMSALLSVILYHTGFLRTLLVPVRMLLIDI